MQERNVLIDSLKGFAIFLMVLGHLIQFTSINDKYLSNPLFIFIYSFHMPLFMMISGFLYEKSLKNHSLISVLKKRILTILLPYFSWTIIFIIIWFLFKGNGLTFLGLIHKIFYTFLTVSKLWFLWVLFISILLLSLGIWSQRWFGKIYLILLLILLLLLPKTEIFGLINIKYMFPFFIVGYYYSEYSNNLKNWKSYATYGSFLIYPAMLFFWKDENYSFIIDFKNIIPILFKFTTAFSGILLIIYVFRMLLKRLNLNYLHRIGRHSIVIYIISDYFIELTSYIIFPNASNNFYLILFFILLTAIIAEICLLIEKLINKNAGLSYILLGNRG